MVVSWNPAAPGWSKSLLIHLTKQKTPQVCGSPSPIGNLYEGLGSWFWSGPSLAIVANWGVNHRWMILSYNSAIQINSTYFKDNSQRREQQIDVAGCFSYVVIIPKYLVESLDNLLVQKHKNSLLLVVLQPGFIPRHYFYPAITESVCWQSQILDYRLDYYPRNRRGVLFTTRKVIKEKGVHGNLKQHKYVLHTTWNNEANRMMIKTILSGFIM